MMGPRRGRITCRSWARRWRAAMAIVRFMRRNARTTTGSSNNERPSSMRVAARRARSNRSSDTSPRGGSRGAVLACTIQS